MAFGLTEYSASKIAEARYVQNPPLPPVKDRFSVNGILNYRLMRDYLWDTGLTRTTARAGAADWMDKGKKINAIKTLRGYDKSLGLKEAKDIIDNWEVVFYGKGY